MKFHVQRTAAFTLVELLIGAGIFFILVLALYGTVSATFRVQSKVAALQEYRAVYQVIDGIARDLENAVMLGNRFSCGFAVMDEKNSARGEEHRLVFLLPGPAGLNEVRYYLALPDEGLIHRVERGQASQQLAKTVSWEQREKKIGNLIREEGALIQPTGEVTGQPQKKIYAKLRERGLRFQYATRQSGQNDLVWQSTWPTCSLPAAVSIELTVADPEDNNQDLIFSRDVLIPRQMTLQGI